MDMANIVSLLALFVLIWITAVYRFSSMAWTILIGVGLLGLTVFGFLSSPVFLIIFWLGFLAAALFANLHEFRQEHFVKPALKLLQEKMPSISPTERIAIEAGDTWWERELFCGEPNWKKLFSIPRPTLSLEEQNFLDHQVNHLCSLVNDWEIINEYHDLSPETWEYLKKEKFFGMVIPKQYGGLGFSALAHSTVVSKIASRSISAAVTTMVPNSLGPGELILHYGTDEQKNYYLPRLAKGEEIPCFALTGPDAGSDAGAILDTGMICRGEHQGKEMIGIRLNWDKRYITLAPVATVLGIAIRLFDPEQLLGEQKEIGITLCLVPTSHPGVEIGSRHYPLHLGFMNGPTRGKDVFIPLNWIIGGTKMAGQGWKMLMESLSIGRSISLPALATGTAKISYRLTGAYSKVRRQFNTSIASFEGIEEALGYIAGYTYILESCRIMTAGAVDQQINPSIVSAIAKYHMTEMSRKGINHGMDIHAGQMIQQGPRNFLANIYYALPISITVEGANILTRNLIIFGQGAIRCHPYILKEVELISEKEPNVKEIDQVLMKHIGFYVSNLLRAFGYGLTGGKLIFAPGKYKKIKKYTRQLTRMSTALTLLSDTSLILLGGSLKRRERLSARLGDIMSQLYLASAVLKYFHDHNEPVSDVDYVCWSLHYCLYKIQTACDELLSNFPNRFIGILLRAIIFPFGNAYNPLHDKLHNSILTAMLAPCELRDRLTKYSYLSNDSHELSNRLDKALHLLTTIEPIWMKLQKAVLSKQIPSWYDFEQRAQVAEQENILTKEEVSKLKEYEELRNEIIKVNEFSFNLENVIA